MQPTGTLSFDDERYDRSNGARYKYAYCFSTSHLRRAVVYYLPTVRSTQGHCCRELVNHMAVAAPLSNWLSRLLSDAANGCALAFCSHAAGSPVVGAFVLPQVCTPSVWRPGPPSHRDRLLSTCLHCPPSAGFPSPQFPKIPKMRAELKIDQCNPALLRAARIESAMRLLHLYAGPLVAQYSISPLSQVLVFANGH